MELENENERIRNIASEAVKSMSEAGEALGKKEKENEKLRNEIIKLNSKVRFPLFNSFSFFAYLEKSPKFKITIE